MLLDVAREGFAEAVAERQVHGTSDGKIGEYKWRGGVGSKGDDAKERGHRTIRGKKCGLFDSVAVRR